MSDAEEIGAYGCLAVLGLMACGVLYSVYALYDGYYSRELPADQTALIDNASGFIIDGIKGAQSVKVTLSNKSEWIITSAAVSFFFEPHSGQEWYEARRLLSIRQCFGGTGSWYPRS